jgi:hypothetical protein
MRGTDRQHEDGWIVLRRPALVGDLDRAGDSAGGIGGKAASTTSALSRVSCGVFW